MLLFGMSSIFYREAKPVKQVKPFKISATILIDERKHLYLCDIIVTSYDTARLRKCLKENLLKAGYNAAKVWKADDYDIEHGTLYYLGHKGIFVADDYGNTQVIILTLPQHYNVKTKKLDLDDVPATRVIDILTSAGRDLETALKSANADFDLTALIKELEKSKQTAAEQLSF